MIGLVSKTWLFASQYCIVCTVERAHSTGLNLSIFKLFDSIVTLFIKARDLKIVCFDTNQFSIKS